MATQDGVPVGCHETEDWVDIAKSVNEDLSDKRVRQVLDVIDKIRAHEIPGGLSLPELVVCGKQSSGKSSVLEAISRIRFPKGEITCTRFVTEIQLVPNNEWCVTASIRPYEKRTTEEKENLLVNADADPSDHKIMDMAKDVDTSAQRTFGIITKPDLPTAGLQTEQAWLRIIRRPDLSTHFKKGAHVLLNGTGRQVQNSNWNMKERDENEESFFAAPEHKSGQNMSEDNAWHALYKGDLWGIKHLRKRLTELLFEHTQRQLPNVHQDIESRLKEYSDALEELGVFWRDPETLKGELRLTMYKMASVTDHGSKGTFATYDAFFDFQKGVRWLRSRIRDESDQFRKDMEAKGHDTEFAWAPDSEQPEDHKKAVEKYYQVIRGTKGAELAGNIDSIKLTLLFKVYSKQWQQLARIYVNSAYNHCDKFAQEVAEVYMRDTLAHMVGRLQTMVLKPLLKGRRGLMMEELDNLELDRNSPAITEHAQFWMKNSERQCKRFLEMSNDAQKLVVNKSAPLDESVLKALKQDTEENVQREAALGLTQQMLIYYKIARARFIDNVIIQVVERRLLKGLETIFLPDWIEDGSTFAAVTTDPRSEDRLQKAKKLSKDIASLEECLKELRSVQ
ncbi:P-loop containing nucleoside triphosphate hydrolase protein [Phaeosphaeriaceae sp. PMI808]|nr:P-loop containing nucleoside triphosphate hydrolase protein [Phaeosphaeriaceae sp. PMI808]